MITVKLHGGLGNQMFQYAFSMNYLHGERLVKYDVSSFEKFRYHNGLELEYVFPSIRLCKAARRDMFFYIESYWDVNRKKQYKLKQNYYYVDETNGYEFELIEDIETVENAYLAGYWQHAGYFARYEKELKREFCFRDIENTDFANLFLKDKILNNTSVSIHIRRGDYLQSSTHRVLPVEYYTEAISYIRSVESNPLFFIFSDDPTFAGELFQGENFIITGHNKNETSFRDMQLMSFCKHNIIANSTFSWWASWLNNRSDKIVICPEKWFTHDIDISGLLLSDWIKV